ncbi:DMT family transporter [Synechococcus sp. Cruz-9H2]|uniref:DMT family transporter n=1 Tax=unclassified Synechococcus TaxID=2626047 RepID=UPI0020CBACD6|nr:MULTISPECIES: DMT family transporter [unclassified Synechococcus]MCP9819590.1 DMT family transporter [Synechococcus sp. Cruz-9H2]MCP9843894.1 DMT family transporter [Synechococcus sp. Edmonson 11F2]MCP9855748.1 DMT family transporter [Synechococcus sp. Cruz-9C9]MCP9863304.1 DMT family transporter [Synechococcus sp. Cruz-7E5]MCP9870383.1 DMT family transporter [Synechococcus sp. Cruz-7B9]
MVPLALYVLLRGLDATVLKGLQNHGANHLVNGENPISFCNVFFVAELVVGLAALLPGRTTLGRDLSRLRPTDRRLLGLDAVLGLFIAPIAYYMALQSLSVISQTLLFALVLPASALLAWTLLRERLPNGFWVSLTLIVAGLLLAQLGMTPVSTSMDQLAGVGWALLGVAAYSGSAVSGRRIASRGLPLAVTVGVPSSAMALVFGLLALVLFGPQHFQLLQLWWVVGVILIYALCLSLGSELSLRQAYRHFDVATVSLWGSLSIPVAAVSAALLLGEPIGWAGGGGLLLLMTGASWSRWSSPIRLGTSPVHPPCRSDPPAPCP